MLSRLQALPVPLVHCVDRITCRTSRHSKCMHVCKICFVCVFSSWRCIWHVAHVGNVYSIFPWSTAGLAAPTPVCLFTSDVSLYLYLKGLKRSFLLRQQLCPSSCTAAMSHQGRWHHDASTRLNMCPLRCGMRCDVSSPEAPG